MVNLCNLDGRVVPEDQARIPVLDRGFLFGDSIYEVVRTDGGVPFAWPEHWKRLGQSAAGLRLALDLDERTVARRVAETHAAADHGESYVRIVVSRGVGSAPNIDLACASGPPCWVILVRQLPDLSGKETRLAIVDRLRNDRRALDPATKSGNYLNNVLALAEAKDAGATDCLMCNQQGHVTESSTSNVFAFVDGGWCTPPLSAGILSGVTRAMLVELMPQWGVPLAERNLTPGDLARAEEIFLSSSLRDIAPATHLDGRALPSGDGVRARDLLRRFREHVQTRLHELDTPRWHHLIGGASAQGAN
jgi:branched-chain amino acid aminotransferase